MGAYTYTEYDSRPFNEISFIFLHTVCSLAVIFHRGEQSHLSNSQDKLCEMNQHIFAIKEKRRESLSTTTCYSPSMSEIICGAMEATFLELDEALFRDSQLYDIQGGCTAIIALFAESKLYVANAGDSRYFGGWREFTTNSNRLGRAYAKI